MTNDHDVDDSTIVIPTIRSDATEDPTATTTPDPVTPPTPIQISAVAREIADLSEACGQPLSVDISALLNEATVFLPSRECFTAWSARLSARDATSDVNDSLGRLVTATFSGLDSGSWLIRLIWHGGISR